MTQLLYLHRKERLPQGTEPKALRRPRQIQSSRVFGGSSAILLASAFQPAILRAFRSSSRAYTGSPAGSFFDFLLVVSSASLPVVSSQYSMRIGSWRASTVRPASYLTAVLRRCVHTDDHSQIELSRAVRFAPVWIGVDGGVDRYGCDKVELPPGADGWMRVLS
jgi:hypothetical protein